MATLQQEPKSIWYVRKVRQKKAAETSKTRIAELQKQVEDLQHQLKSYSISSRSNQAAGNADIWRTPGFPQVKSLGVSGLDMDVHWWQERVVRYSRTQPEHNLIRLCDLTGKAIHLARLDAAFDGVATLARQELARALDGKKVHSRRFRCRKCRANLAMHDALSPHLCEACYKEGAALGKWPDTMAINAGVLPREPEAVFSVGEPLSTDQRQSAVESCSVRAAGSHGAEPSLASSACSEEVQRGPQGLEEPEKGVCSAPGRWRSLYRFQFEHGLRVRCKPGLNSEVWEMAVLIDCRVLFCQDAGRLKVEDPDRYEYDRNRLFGRDGYRQWWKVKLDDGFEYDVPARSRMAAEVWEPSPPTSSSREKKRRR